MRKWLTNFVIGVCVLAFIGGTIWLVGYTGRIAIGLLAAPEMPSPAFKTQMSMGIVLLLTGGIIGLIGKWVREVCRQG